MFKSELTAINTRHSKSAEMVLEMVKEGENVLDYGCGTGRNLMFLNEQKKGINLVGCDIEEQLKHSLEKHNNVRNAGIEVVETSKVEGKFDYILCSHVLNVIESDSIKEGVLKDIKAHLKEGGKAIIEVRTIKDVEGAKSKIAHGNGYKIKKGKNFTYQEGISKEKMAEMIANAGLSIEEHICNNSKHIVVVK